MLPLLLVLIFGPLAGALVAGLGGRFLPTVVSQAVTTGLLILSAVLAWTVFPQALAGTLEAQTYTLAPFINVGEFQSNWSIRLDTLSAVMLVVVTTVSALVHVYSWGYMAEDPHKPRFFAYLSLFTFAMLMLVTAADFMQLFFGWEGVGLASYLLIGFWFKKPTANAASIKAFVVNRVGDFGFALGIMTVFWAFGTIQFAELFPQMAGAATRGWVFAGHTWSLLDLAGLLLFVGAMGKSAQFFLHTWLPDAMEGPTPVSALIHAATMVTAGVYMVCLLSPLYEYAPTAKAVITILGAVTALFAATVGLAQNDIKRVIAYSTCSQLGYMFFAAGLGMYQAAMFHLFTHAFFKALLFLGAGSVIHGMHHEQDMRNMGGTAKYLPLTYGVMLIGTLAITGIGLPPLHIGFAGFHSKDAIIEGAFEAATSNPLGMFAFIVGLTAAALTAFYSWRLIFMTFHGRKNWQDAHAHHHADDHASDAQHETHSEPDVSDYAHAAVGHADSAHGHGHGHDHGEFKPHESPWVMMVPLLILSVGAVAAGFAFGHSFVGDGQAGFWNGSLFNLLPGRAEEEAHAGPPTWVLWAPLIVSILGGLVAAWVYLFNRDFARRVAENRGPLWSFLYNKWYFDELYQATFVRGAKALGDLFWKGGDQKIIDGLGPNGVAAAAAESGRRLTKIQSGFVYHYAFVMLLGVAGLLTYALFSWGA